MKIGITGVAGFIGSNLADALVDRSFTYISDLVDGIVRAAEYQAYDQGLSFRASDEACFDCPGMFEVADSILAGIFPPDVER